MILASSIVGRLHRSSEAIAEGRIERGRFGIDEGMQAAEYVRAVVSLVWLFADLHAQRELGIDIMQDRCRAPSRSLSTIMLLWRNFDFYKDQDEFL